MRVSQAFFHRNGDAEKPIACLNCENRPRPTARHFGQPDQLMARKAEAVISRDARDNRKFGREGRSHSQHIGDLAVACRREAQRVRHVDLPKHSLIGDLMGTWVISIRATKLRRLIIAPILTLRGGR